MARNDQKTDQKPDVPAREPINPPVIDTTKLTGAEPDPRGDPNPGVLADQPGTPGFNPVTNRDEREMASDGVTLRPAQPSEPLNPPVTDTPPTAPGSKTVGGRYKEIEVNRDYWPRAGNRNRPKNLPEDGEWRIKAGETVSLPEDEAEDLQESGIGKRPAKKPA